MDRRILLLAIEMRLEQVLLAHLLDLHVVIQRDAADCDDQAGQVNRCKRVVEDQVCGRDGYNFLEDTADAERDDRGALQQSELGRCHKEGETAGKEEDADAEGGALLIEKTRKAFLQGAEAFDRDGEDEDADEHDGCEEED